VINVVTVNTGGYVSHHVTNVIHQLAKRFISGDTAHYCFTDSLYNLNPAITAITEYHKLGGWWDKLNLFSEHMPKGRYLYLDLDCLPVGDLDPLIESYKGKLLGDEDPIHYGEQFFANHANDDYKKIDCSLGTAFLVGDSGKNKGVLAKFLKDPEQYRRDFKKHGDQVFTSYALNGKFDLLERVMPTGHGFYSYKFDLLKQPAPNLIGRGMPATPRLINFHGDPKWWALKHTQLVKDAMAQAEGVEL